MTSSTCWICGMHYVTDYCPACGPPEPLGPTLAELRAAGPYTPESPKCRHGVPYSDPCTRCELGMLRDAVDDMVSEAECRERWREP